MHSKRTLLLALAIIVLIIPFGTGIAAADSGNSGTSANNESLSMTGYVMNAGTQAYTLRGGQLFMGSEVMGFPINSQTATLHYSMFSVVYGMNVWGVSHIVLKAQTMDGKSVNVESWGFINESQFMPIPVGCAKNCTSEIPFFFMGGSEVEVNMGGKTMTMPLAVSIESPYLNPFGGPIVISMMTQQGSPAIVLIAKYNVGTINWFGVKMGGVVAQTNDVAQTAHPGSFAMNVNSRENLVTGVEYDQGRIALMGLKDHNFEGTFYGISTVPSAGEQDCSSWFWLPAGTCTMTGLDSAGTMNLRGGNFALSGTYVTMWAIPAIGFASSVSATLTHLNAQSEIR
ncbi:MAG TPA: hypothetical protein VJN71_09670 [Nitrososphaerales archaeon]|nr:hypothetical protein [Nitrososphaerales archaeon]